MWEYIYKLILFFVTVAYDSIYVCSGNHSFGYSERDPKGHAETWIRNVYTFLK